MHLCDLFSVLFFLSRCLAKRSDRDCTCQSRKKKLVRHLSVKIVQALFFWALTVTVKQV